MRFNDCQEYFGIYVNTPEVCQLVILFDDREDDIIKGRALLWKLKTPENKTFLDRIYTIADSDVNLFKDFAKENDWLYKEDQDSSPGPILDKDDKYYDNIKVQVKPMRYDYYPYVDTLCNYNPETGILSNIMLHETGEIEMRDTEGGGNEETERERMRQALEDMSLEDIADNYNHSYIWNKSMMMLSVLTWKMKKYNLCVMIGNTKILTMES